MAAERVRVVAGHLLPAEAESAESQFTAIPTAAAVYPAGKTFVTDPTQRLARYQGDGGPTPARIFPDVFRERVKALPTLKAMAQKRGARDGPWTFWTWEEYHADVMRVAKALIALGCTQHGAVNVLAWNSPEWFFAAIGAIFSGMTPAGIYTTNSSEAVEYILNHSKSQVIFVDSDPQLQKVLAVRGACPHLKAIVHWGPDCPAAGTVPGVMSWQSFLKMGDATPEDAVEARIRSQHPDNAFYLSYTSGTTGNPKAVMYSHDNILWGFKYLVGIMLKQQGGDAGLEEREVSYMPLSHIAGNLQLLGALTRPLTTNTCVYFALPDAMQGTLPLTLKDVRPTFFFAVPRVWEKFGVALQPALKAQPALRSNLAALKGLIGLDQVKSAVTGAAPIATSLMEFFDSIELPIYEIYGMTENAAYSHFSFPGRRCIGSVGPALMDEGADVKLAPGTGEICTWSRAVMMGYMYDHDKSLATFDDDGYLKTGDIGKVDSDGLTYITGRIKEILITAGGENCAPVLLEEAIKLRLNAVSNVVMIGDRQKYLVALMTLKLEPDGLGGFTDKLAPEALAVDPGCATVQQAMNSQKWRDYVQAGVDAANDVAISRAQQTRKWVLLPGDFMAVGAGAELTPTMKLKRDVVAKKDSEVIKGIYGRDFTSA